MTAKQAAEFVNVIKPETVIPTHYGEIVGSIEDGNLFKQLVEPSIAVVFKLS